MIFVIFLIQELLNRVKLGSKRKTHNELEYLINNVLNLSKLLKHLTVQNDYMKLIFSCFSTTALPAGLILLLPQKRTVPPLHT